MAKHKTVLPEVSSDTISLPFSREAFDATPLPIPGFTRLPGVLRLIPIKKSTWWNWVKDGKAPAAHKLSPGVTVWRNSELLEFLARQGREKEEA